MNDNKRKVLIPIFNRAHYGRLRSVLRAISAHPKLELQVMVGTPAAYDHFFTNIKHSRPHTWRLSLPWYLRARMLSLLDKIIPGTVLKNDVLAKHIVADGIPVHARVPIFFDGGMAETMAKSVGFGIMGIVDQLKKLKPDVVFVNADRFEMMAITLAAAYLNIPIAHNEGGDISGTIDESIRHAITKFAHLHFTATERSKKRVLQMGEHPDHVFHVGSPSIDLLKAMDLSFPKERVPGIDLATPYLVVLSHPVATESKEYNAGMARSLVAALKEVQMPTILLGSNVDAGSDEVGKALRAWIEQEKPSNVFFTKHLHPDDFFRVIANAACAVGNSSSFIREGAYLGTPAVLIGSRQQNRDKGKNVQEVGVEQGAITAAIRAQLAHGRYERDTMFGSGDAAARMAEILAEAQPSIQKRFHEA